MIDRGKKITTHIEYNVVLMLDTCMDRGGEGEGALKMHFIVYYNVPVITFLWHIWWIVKLINMIKTYNK